MSRERLSLDGQWKLLLDPEDAGKDAGWYRAVPTDAPSIAVQVPSVWDRWAPDYDGVGWYYHTFEAQSAWADRHVDLCFEAADYYAEVWLNGVRLGSHEGGYTPFAFSVAAHLNDHENLLAVRLIDPHGEDGFGDFRPKEIPCAKEEGYFSFAGIWGSVYLEAKAKAHIEDIFVRPDLRRKRITVDVATSDAGQIHLQIQGTPHEIEGPPGELVIEFPDFECWSPETPVCYTLKASLLQEDAVCDQLEVRFGMREFTAKDKRFYLNNHPLFIKAALHQPDFPASLTGPETEAMARREIELAKKAGFNMLRLHIKTAPKITLDLADELGILLYEEPPIGWIKDSEFLRERCEREVREMILRDRNHPSVVLWGILNESGNADYVSKGGAQLLKDDLCKLARELDPSRLIIDDSGGVNSTREPARFMRPYREEFEAYDDLHIYQRAPVDHTIESYYRHNGDPETLYFLSEFGFGGPEDLKSVIAKYGEEKETLKDARFLQNLLDSFQEGFEERNLDRVFGDFSGFCKAGRQLQCDALRYQIDAIRANPKCAGYCYTQLFDAGHEFCAGIGDRWRRPKPALKAMAEVQKPLRPIIQIIQTNLVPRQEAPVTVLLANEDKLEGRADLSLQVVGPTNQVLWKKKRSVKLPRHGKELWSGSIAASGSPGPHKFVVRVIQNMRVITQNSVELYVLKPTEPTDIGVHILDNNRVWQKKFSTLAKPANLLAPIHIIPPLANTIRAYPDNELMQCLAQVKGGAIALFFAPPEDWNDLAAQLEANLEATAKDAVGCFLPAFHYVKLHPVFSELPARGLMRQPYRNVIPPKTFVEKSDEDICGAFDTAPVAAGNFMVEKTPWWGSDILVRRYGSGRIVFTHLRLVENLGEDPLADKLFVNLLKHFARRSVPSASPVPIHQKSVEWLRKERGAIRRWMVLGEFPNWGGAGHATAYPPESEIDFEASYPGWYKLIAWKPWYTQAKEDHILDLQQAFTPLYEYYPRFDHATGYAYTEFTSEKRMPISLRLGLQNATKIWLNGQLVFESTTQIPHDHFEPDEADAQIRQGRNTLLVKCSKIPGPFRFSLDFASKERESIQIQWWR